MIWVLKSDVLARTVHAARRDGLRVQGRYGVFANH